ncbi:MAG: bifunctional homocysteine S-methyltransferase/methylenetetrahydrofolate reductase [Spirochaetota bacterium]
MNKKAEEFLEVIQSQTLLGDGAIGTELLKTGSLQGASIEGLNLKSPEIVRSLHREYIVAGSQVIETNSFGANRINLAQLKLDRQVKEINSAAVDLAREAAGASNVFIAGSIGPVRTINRSEEEQILPEEKCAALKEHALILVESGIDILILETFTDLNELLIVLQAIREQTNIPIIAQMAFEEGGRTPHGFNGSAVASALIDKGADIVGANCGAGVPAVMAAAREMLGCGKPVSAYLNAGFAERLEGRHVFTAGDSYLAERAAELARMNVRLIGGCCGTSPSTIKAMAKLLKKIQPSQARFTITQTFSEKKKIIKAETIVIPKGVLVELDPPKDLDLSGIRSSAEALVNSGIRYITLADNPLASVRVDNITTAGILRNEFGAIPIPHITGRDRNRIALQSSIMAAHCVGIRNLLCVTGDPVRMYHEANTSGVFDVNSVSLVKMVSEFNLGQRLDPDNLTAFAIGVAFNPNVRSIEGQLNKLERKIEAGAHFALTQPVYTSERMEAVLEGLNSRGIDIPVFCGLLPLTSSRNAEFLHNEVPGIVIPDEFRKYLARFPKLEDQKKAAGDLAIGLAESLLNVNRLFYLISPRNNVDLILPIVDFLKSKDVQLV